MEDQDLMGVYRIVAPSGSCYIGATAESFRKRWNAHLKDFKLSKTRCQGLRRAFSKYGVENMAFEILEIVSRDDESSVWKLERVWWNRLKSEGVNLYNGEPTGTGSVHHTLETRERISSALSKRSMLKVCGNPSCAKTFETKRDARVFCSSSCSATVSNMSRQLEYSYDFLYDLYWTQGLSRSKIMKLLGISVRGFQNLFARHGIPMRTLSQAASLSAGASKTKVCLEKTCEKTFTPRRSIQKYCSRNCADSNR